MSHTLNNLHIKILKTRTFTEHYFFLNLVTMLRIIQNVLLIISNTDINHGKSVMGFLNVQNSSF